MASPEILEYAAFTTDPSGGNPAGVVLDASQLTEQEMLTIAAELGHSESAFVTGPYDHEAAPPGRGFRIRYFSPLAEVPFCGHATVATAAALAEHIGPGDLLLSTGAGDVPVSVLDDHGVLRATLTSVPPYVEDAEPDDVDAALGLLGWRPDELDQDLPPRIAYAGARHLVLAAATRQRLADLDYDFDGLAELMHELDLTTVQLVWRASADTFVVRDPFPVGGVVEDPATGAAALALGAYLRDLNAVPLAAVLTIHQGDDLGRPSRLEVELRANDDRIRVTGAAVCMTPPAAAG
jgi:PhzF family phenazine biosynthesis protein